MFHKVRHINKDLYIKAIKRQSRFLRQLKTVPICGIPEDMMHHLMQDLMTIEGVYQVN